MEMNPLKAIVVKNQYLQRKFSWFTNRNYRAPRHSKLLSFLAVFEIYMQMHTLAIGHSHGVLNEN